MVTTCLTIINRIPYLRKRQKVRHAQVEKADIDMVDMNLQSTLQCRLLCLKIPKSQDSNPFVIEMFHHIKRNTQPSPQEPDHTSHIRPKFNTYHIHHRFKIYYIGQERSQKHKNITFCTILMSPVQWQITLSGKIWTDETNAHQTEDILSKSFYFYKSEFGRKPSENRTFDTQIFLKIPKKCVFSRKGPGIVLTCFLV